jgi:predicted extracellular nuclease
MKKSVLFIAMFFIAIFATAQTDLFFSEYVEGSGNNKGVEIYNPTTQTIDLTSYWVARFSNGESTFTSGGVTQLTGTLEPYKTHVLVNGQTTSTPTSPACDPALQAIANQLDHDYPAPTYMNGNDAIALLKTPNGETPLENMSNVTSVDLIGQIGLGSAISSETGWSYVKDSTLTYNNAAGEPVTGKVVNYIVRK